MLAVFRASESCIGIVCAGIVLAGTDLGAPSAGSRPHSPTSRPRSPADLPACWHRRSRKRRTRKPSRRELARRVIALDPSIDQVLGESSHVRYHSPILQSAVHGLFTALDGWRAVAAHLDRLPNDTLGMRRRPSCAAFRRSCARRRSEVAGSLDGRSRPSAPICEAAVRRLIALPAGTPSLRLLADQTAKVLAGMAQALDGLALLVADPARTASSRSRRPAPRARLAAGPRQCGARIRHDRRRRAVLDRDRMAEWRLGHHLCRDPVILFAPRADQAYAAAMGFMVGTVLAAVFAAIVKFALLPGLETFAGFSLALGLYLVPAGALIAQPWQTATVHRDGGQFRAAARAREPDELRHGAILQHRAGDRRRHRRGRRFRSACCRRWRRRCGRAGSSP